MTIQDKLQIIIVTYNRRHFLERTLQQLLDEKSPVRDFSITVLDNNSTDGTEELVKQFQLTHSHLKHHKNAYNLGLGGNIARALEMGTKDYLWVLCDDDVYDFSNWAEVEQAVERGEKCLCVSRYALPEEHKHQPEYQLLQMTFLPATIYHKSVFSDTVIRNAQDNIYTLFPHLCPVLPLINREEPIFVVSRAIVTRHMEKGTDGSYTRGAKPQELYPRSCSMLWMIGYADILAILKDKKLKARCLEVAAVLPDVATRNFTRASYLIVRQGYFTPLYWAGVYDFSLQLNFRQQCILRLCRLYCWFKYGLIRFYSTENARFVCLLNTVNIKLYNKKQKPQA